MRRQIFLALLLSFGFSVAAYGKEGFNFFSSECKAEAEAGMDGAPQSPPLGVDDPGTAGCNTWETNVLVDGDISHEEKSWEAPLLDINYGIGDNLQVKLEIPWLVAKANEKSQSALGNSKTGIKYHFYSQKTADLELAIYPQIQFASIGSKAEDKGLESSGSIVSLPLIIGMTVGKSTYGDIKLGINMALSRSNKKDVEDSTSLSAAIGLPVSKSMAVMAEIATERANKISTEGNREELLSMTVGALTEVTDTLSVFASLGRSLKASDHLQHFYPLLGIRLSSN